MDWQHGWTLILVISYFSFIIFAKRACIFFNLLLMLKSTRKHYNCNKSVVPCMQTSIFLKWLPKHMFIPQYAFMCEIIVLFFCGSGSIIRTSILWCIDIMEYLDAPGLPSVVILLMVKNWNGHLNLRISSKEEQETSVRLIRSIKRIQSDQCDKCNEIINRATYNLSGRYKFKKCWRWIEWSHKTLLVKERSTFKPFDSLYMKHAP